MGKKKKETKKENTSEDLYVERLTAYVEGKLKREVWNPEDRARRQLRKKLSKKEKFKQDYQRLYQLKEAVATTRKQLIEEEEERRLSKIEAAEEKEVKDKYENELREEVLTKSCDRLKELEQAYLETEKQHMEFLEWNEYIKCDGLPNPKESGEMRTYLHLWDQVKDRETLEDSCVRTKQVLQLLEVLRKFRCNATSTIKQHREWFDIECEFKKYQKWNLDHACYMLLRNIEKHMNRESIKIANFVHEDKFFTICLWLRVQLPKPRHNPKKARRKRPELNFPEIQMEVLFPENMDIGTQCVRAMFIGYDHYSSTSKNFIDPEPCDLHLINLLEATQLEWEERVQIMKINAELLQAPAENLRPPLPNDPEAQDDLTKTISYIYISKEDNIYQEIRNSWEKELHPDEICLRKYSIVGGIYVLELLYQPPQPDVMVLQNISVTSLLIPKWLHQVPFKSEDGPLHTISASTISLHPTEPINPEEAERNASIYIEITLHTKNIWLDQPIICSWDEECNMWTTKYVTDAVFNEKELKISFRTSRFGVYSVAINKYCCMPFRDWEITRNPDGSILLEIVTQLQITMHFHVDKTKVCLYDIPEFTMLQKKPLKDILGVYFPLRTLQHILIEKGINLFPLIDAACYIDDISEKHWALVKHTYYQMAQGCWFFKFSYSKWNSKVDRRHLVIQVREWFENEKLFLRLADKISTFTCLVTPLNATLIKCQENEDTFSDEELPNQKFHPDLMHLLVDLQNLDAKRKMARVTPIETINTLTRLLIATRLLSTS